ncbi:monovalent cation/H(+) antiporter subunit G [Rhodopseudomonas palustris]|uniref:monovalent cation/H(+) antiporter subunit G n=1 Tax=Rhodopseudomonas palustris TaxID=1076 RepID=UPI0020CD8EC9|nr:monovalent cation/H(+) antiporter subunit G [Rhodopseudomonas palustris]MCP9626914.1 monovalent cation/H(+) antiporter subunit G [Rhodopseudomonas palustris]
MTHAADLPAWAAWAVSALLLAGAGITLIGSLGLLRLGSFYQRAHAPTLGTSLGTALIAGASMLCFSLLQMRPLLHEVLILGFVTITTPVTLMLLARAAMFRDTAESPQDDASSPHTEKPQKR